MFVLPVWLQSVVMALSFVLSTGCFLTGCKLPQRTPHCAFSDAETMVPFGVCLLAAEHYVAHKEWPLSQAELEAQSAQLLKELEKRSDLAPEEKEAWGSFFSHITRLTFRRQGDSLELRIEFRIDGKTFRRTVVLKPGAEVDAILESLA